MASAAQILCKGHTIVCIVILPIRWNTPAIKCRWSGLASLGYCRSSADPAAKSIPIDKAAARQPAKITVAGRGNDGLRLYGDLRDCSRCKQCSMLRRIQAWSWRLALPTAKPYNREHHTLSQLLLTQVFFCNTKDRETAGCALNICASGFLLMEAWPPMTTHIGEGARQGEGAEQEGDELDSHGNDTRRQRRSR